MLISKIENACELSVKKDSIILLFGGEPFEEERHIFWNFVSSDKQKLEVAKEKWKNHEFPKVTDDATYIPLP